MCFLKLKNIQIFEWLISLSFDTIDRWLLFILNAKTRFTEIGKNIQQNKSMMDKNIGDSADGFQNIIIWIIVIGEIQKAISFLINIPGNEMNIFICFSHLTE